MYNWPLMKNSITLLDKFKLIQFILTSDRFTQGIKVEEFETRWSEWLGAKHSLFVTSGSTADFLLVASIIEKYNLKNNVFFLQHAKEMPVAYYISDVVVSSSIEPEAFGRVSVEAQAMRRPILASDHGGSKETIINGKSGFLFENNKPDVLAENLNKLMEMDKDKLQLIGNEGRKNILKKFDVEQMCNSTFIEYKKLIK